MAGKGVKENPKEGNQENADKEFIIIEDIFLQIVDHFRMDRVLPENEK